VHQFVIPVKTGIQILTRRLPAVRLAELSPRLPCLPCEALPFRAKWGACRRDNAIRTTTLSLRGLPCRPWQSLCNDTIDIQNRQFPVALECCSLGSLSGIPSASALPLPALEASFLVTANGGSPHTNGGQAENKSCLPA